MKSNLLNALSLLRVFMVAALAVFCVSCDETETTDSTGFILHYYGVTDIGPSMSYTLQAPTYKGSAPYDFTITNITLNDEAFSNEDNFVIDAETGAITIQNTGSMAAGLYNISVGCYSNGGFHNFKDVVQVNMLLAVPEGVTVEPAEVLVNQDEENWVEASALVTTEKDKHVSISGYTIAQDETKPYLSYFTFDSNIKNKIIIRESEKDKLVAGESYTLSLKLTTKAGEHMYADAVTFKVVSKPRDLFYVETEALPDLFEAGSENKSAIPTIAGSKENLKFSIKSVTPESTAFTIDEATGQISVPAGNSLEISETPYVFNITASNTYGSKDFEAIYSVKIVAFIEPIKPETFNYTAVNKLYQLGGSLDNKEPDAGFVGGAPTFQFDENNSEEIKEQIAQGIISLNSANGAISITNNHTLTAQTHEIKVKVTNKKNEEGVVKALAITVVENPNNFTYVSWGTNIENEIPIDATKSQFPISTECKLEQNINNRNLFRFIQNRDVVEIPVQDTDNKGASNFKYEVLKDNYIGNSNIVSTADTRENGTIYFKELTGTKNFKGGGGNGEGCVFQIKVTASGNSAPAVTRNIPIFISTPKPEKKMTTYNSTTQKYENEKNMVILCEPFVIKANPKTGKCMPFTYKVYNIGANNIDGIQKNFNLEQALSTNNLVWDYYASYAYCNFDSNSNHATGTQENNLSMLNQVWDNCGIVTKTDNSPMRYYNADGLQDTQKKKAGYIDGTSHQLTINPDVWIGKDGKYPNGVMRGQMRFNMLNDKKDLQANKNGITVSQYHLYIWLDETYEGN